MRRVLERFTGPQMQLPPMYSAVKINGQPLYKACLLYTSFVTVIAWAVGPDGKVLKASGTTELTLHRGGLEAKRNADGSLEVVSYADGNLNGLAEQRVLKESEYTLVENGDGTTTVQALEKRLGSCVLQDLDKKDEGERT